MNRVTINGVTVGDGHPAYIIAEASCNHNGSLATGKELIQAAKECGASAVKFQNYLAKDFVCKDNVMYDVFKSVEQKKEFFEELYDYAQKIGMTMFSTAAAIEGADEIEAIGMPAIKLGSSNINNFPLLEHVATKKVPILFSAGLATLEEIEETVRFFEDRGRRDILFFHCVAVYPARIEDVNARFIQTLKARFPYPIGYSDHTIGIHAAVASVCVGANMIEKHFTLDNKMKGPDHSFSADPKVMKEMIEAIREVEKALGTSERKLAAEEWGFRNTARRYVVANKSISKGDALTRDKLTTKKPGPKPGLEPKYLSALIGKVAARDILEEEPITWEDIIGGKRD